MSSGVSTIVVREIDPRGKRLPLQYAMSYEPAEMIECFSAAERTKLGAGAVVTKRVGPIVIYYVSATVLASKAIDAAILAPAVRS